MNRLFSLTLLLLFAGNLSAMPGKVVLNNGHSLAGDVQKLDDGGCWITLKSGSVKFEKTEIKKIIVYSTRDRVRENFLASFRNTPKKRSSAAPVTTPYDGIVDRAARKHNIDPALVKAVMKAESNFNPFDTSVKGACGLMQLMPGTARLLGVKNIYSPEENVNAGTHYLRDMLSRYNGDVEKALAAYNAGPGAVNRYRRVPPYRETREYVRNVRRYYRTYHTPGKVSMYQDESGRLNLYNAR